MARRDFAKIDGSAAETQPDPDVVQMDAADMRSLAALGDAMDSAKEDAEIAMSKAKLAMLEANRAFRSEVARLAAKYGFNPDVHYRFDRQGNRLIKVVGQ